MATDQEVQEALADAIVNLANKASASQQSLSALRFAMAANNLAEAGAWMFAPAQDHGGTSYADAKS
jgi:hypothetical protein